MIVSEFKENNSSRFDEQFLELLPDFCYEDGCGYPMEMSEVLTKLHCSNPRCPAKLAQRLTSLAQDLGIKNLGESTSRSFFDTLGVTNPLLIFAYEPDVDGAIDGKSVDTCLKIMEQFKNKKKFTLAEYVRIANLPFIQTSTLAIFGGYDDLGKAYEDIEAGGVEFIQDKLSIARKEDEVSIRAIKIYDTLMEFKHDLFQALPFIEIIPMNSDNIKSIKNVDSDADDFVIAEGDVLTIKAVCSTEVGGTFRTKADFYATVNNLFGNIHVDFLKSVTKDIDYLVWAGADGKPGIRVTNKVTKARGYNEKYNTGIKIVTAYQFLKEMERLSGTDIDADSYM